MSAATTWHFFHCQTSVLKVFDEGLLPSLFWLAPVSSFLQLPAKIELGGMQQSHVQAITNVLLGWSQISGICGFCCAILYGPNLSPTPSQPKISLQLWYIQCLWADWSVTIMLGGPWWCVLFLKYISNILFYS